MKEVTDKFQDDFKGYRKHEDDHWNKIMSDVMKNAQKDDANKDVSFGEKGATDGSDHQHYVNTAATIESIKPSHIGELRDNAKIAVDANDAANKDSYKYVDDMMRLADGTSTGYNRMATQHFYAYDQIQGQILEAQEKPGHSIKIYFPLQKRIRFKGGTANFVQPETTSYLEGEFKQHLKEKLEKYKGMHFTFCFHASTNLDEETTPAGDFEKHDKINVTNAKWGNPPVSYVPDEESRGKLERGERSLGSQIMLDSRMKAVSDAVEKVVKEDMSGIPESKYTIPPPSNSSRHWGDKDNSQHFQAGAVLMIVAEDRYHHDGYMGKAVTDKEVEDFYAKNEDKMKEYDRQNCKIDDFHAVDANVDYYEAMGPTIATAPFMYLAQSPRQQPPEVKNTGPDAETLARLKNGELVAHEWLELLEKHPGHLTHDLISAEKQAKYERNGMYSNLSKEEKDKNLDKNHKPNPTQVKKYLAHWEAIEKEEEALKAGKLLPPTQTNAEH